MDQEQILEAQLNRVEDFLSNSGKGPKGLWKLYQVKFADSNFSYKDQIDSNFDSTSIEESISILDRAIKRHGPYSNRFFVLVSIVGPKDNKIISLVMPNPFFDASNMKGYKTDYYQSNSINGIHSPNSMMLDFMKEHYSTTQQLREDFKELQHTHEIERMQDRIAALEEGQKGPLDTVIEHLNSDVGKQLVNGLIGIIQAKTVNNNNPTNYNFPGPKNEEYSPNSDSDNEEYSPDQKEKITQLNNAILKMDQVFNGNGLQAIFELAEFCANNPDKAHLFRNMNKAQNDV